MSDKLDIMAEERKAAKLALEKARKKEEANRKLIQLPIQSPTKPAAGGNRDDGLEALLGPIMSGATEEKKEPVKRI